MRIAAFAAVLSVFAACDSSGRSRGPVTMPAGDGGVASGPGPGNISGCDPSNSPPNGDQDGDGYSPAQGDCNDCNPAINPGAIQIPGDSTDYACNGMPGVVAACDASIAGMRDPTSLAHAMDLCDPRFFKSATMVGPSDQRARKVVGKYGVLMPRAGAAMSLVSSGIAADKTDPDFNPISEEDPGTDLSDTNTFANPAPSLMGVAGCSQTQPPTVNDYSELVVKLKAPTNANSLSFDFEFFSAEYPMFVCTEYNDEFLVLQESKAFTKPTNIAFDMHNNAITINSGFFTVCTNDPTNPHTQNCTMPVSGIAGTGFEDTPGGGLFGGIPGGGTGWLTTTSPVMPGEDVTLHFIIFEEGDHILDSAAIIYNFRWGASSVSTPMTAPIL
jgi:hypothetical protein